MSEKETHQKQRKHTKAEEHVGWRFGEREREREREVLGGEETEWIERDREK